MAERDEVDRRRRGLLTHERLELLVVKHTLDGAQPVRPLRMTRRVEMVEAGRVGDQKGRQ